MPRRDRVKDIRAFYQILYQIKRHRKKKFCYLKKCRGQCLPEKGVYFFFEPRQRRSTHGNGLRVVRVGTHAVKRGAKRTLWERLREHKSGGKSSVFCALVKEALGKRRHKKDVAREVIADYIGKMPFLFIEVPGPRSWRAFIERNAIMLLSNHGLAQKGIDLPTRSWLGKHCEKHTAVRESGLWNNQHVKSHDYAPGFLKSLRNWFRRQSRRAGHPR